jgi:adenylate cyclase
VAVMFCDVVGFTPYCETRDPEEVFHALQRVVEVYEDLALEHGLEKIKTIGDSFMATAGLLRPAPDPALSAVRCALEMLNRTRDLQPGWDVRIGIHIGPVMAGVVGHRQYIFDLWGDTVNTAARIESHGTAGAVNVSRATWDRLEEACQGVSLGPVHLKGKGVMEIIRITGVRERALEGVPG